MLQIIFDLIGGKNILEWLTQLPPYIIFPIIVIVFTIAGIIVNFIIKRHISNRLHAEYSKIIVRTLGSAIMFWGFLIGVILGYPFLSLPDYIWYYYLDIIIFIAIALSVTYVIAHIIGDLFKSWGTKFGPQTKQVFSLGRFFIKLIVLTIGLLVILGTLGIEITPILASLGIAALAFALALQPTLANLFAGFYILADKPIRVGDYIRLEGGQEGYVEDIGWRSVRVRMLPNNIVIIPNQKLAESVVINYYYPEERMALLLEIGVSYEDDPIKVEKILVEETVKASFEIDGMVTAYEMRPFVRFMPGYKDFSLNFTLICQVRECVDQYFVQHELRKRIWIRFKKEGITIPFPIRTLHFPGKYFEDLKELDLFSGKGVKNE